MNFRKKVTKTNYAREYIRVLNGLFDLTPREIDVLTSLIKLDATWEPRSTIEVKDLLSTDSRRIVLKESGMNKTNFIKVVNKLKSIGLLVLSKDNKYVINELLKPVFIKDKGKEYIEIKFILELSDVVQ